MSEELRAHESLLKAHPTRNASKGPEEGCGVPINEKCPQHPVLYREGLDLCEYQTSCRIKDTFLKSPDKLKRCRFGVPTQKGRNLEVALGRREPEL